MILNNVSIVIEDKKHHFSRHIEFDTPRKVLYFTRFRGVYKSILREIFLLLVKRKQKMKNILITGTSSGFGKATADHLTQLGYNVVGTSRKPAAIQSNHKMIQLDVQDDQSVRMAVEKAIEIMGSIDVLVNNAGYAVSGPIEETSIEEVKDQLDTNFFGVVRTTQAVLPHMREQKKGLIINISSLGGLVGMPFQGFYCASKFALEGFTEALRIEVKPFGIHVLNINPGDYKTEATANRKIISNLTEVYEERCNHILNQYIKDEMNGGNPIEIAKLIEKLVKKEGNYKVRYLIGKLPQKAAAQLKRFISSRSFERILVNIYR